MYYLKIVILQTCFAFIIIKNTSATFLLSVCAYQTNANFYSDAFPREYISAHHIFPLAYVTKTWQMSLKS